MPEIDLYDNFREAIEPAMTGAAPVTVEFEVWGQTWYVRASPGHDVGSPPGADPPGTFSVGYEVYQSADARENHEESIPAVAFSNDPYEVQRHIRNLLKRTQQEVGNFAGRHSQSDINMTLGGFNYIGIRDDALADKLSPMPRGTGGIHEETIDILGVGVDLVIEHPRLGSQDTELLLKPPDTPDDNTDETFQFSMGSSYSDVGRILTLLEKAHRFARNDIGNSEPLDYEMEF
jgi:hypothetical protein